MPAKPAAFSKSRRDKVDSFLVTNVDLNMGRVFSRKGAKTQRCKEKTMATRQPFAPLREKSFLRLKRPLFSSDLFNALVGPLFEVTVFGMVWSAFARIAGRVV